MESTPALPSIREREEFLAHALRFVDGTRRVILDRWKAGLHPELKGDKSFVTEADLEAELFIRDAVAKHFPHHGVIGEEHPNTNPEAEFQWVVDPIDGTQNFVHGVPTFGTILGLHFRGVPLIGVIDHPALDSRCWGGKGLGVKKDGEPVRIVDTNSATLDVNEIIATSTRGMFERTGEGPLLDRFMQMHGATRIFYDVFGHTMAVCGNVGALVEFNVRIWDLAAAPVLVEEAGGRCVEVRRTEQPGKAPLISVIMGKPSVVEALLPLFQKASAGS